MYIKLHVTIGAKNGADMTDKPLISLDATAQVRLDALPGDFLDFVADPEIFAEQLVAEAA